MTSQSVLLTIWVLISILILAYSVLNAVSLLSLEARVNAIDKNDGNTPLKILVNNWDIVIVSTLGVFMLLSLFIEGVREWYYNHVGTTAFLFITMVLLSAGIIVLKRIILAKKYWKCNDDNTACVRDTSGGTDYTTDDCDGDCGTPAPPPPSPPS